MSELDKYLNMLKSHKASVRYDACELLRVATESSPDIILALEEVAHDKDAYVAERARAALDADVHLYMAKKMGRTPPVEQYNKRAQDQISPIEESHVAAAETKKCPFCAETIKYEAIVCRYCGRDLPKNRQVSEHDNASIPEDGEAEPSIMASLFFMGILGLLVGACYLFAALLFGGASGRGEVPALSVLLIGEITIAILGVSGYRPDGAKPINYIGMVLLAFMPPLNLIPYYYAGKAVAQTFGPKVSKALVGIFIVILIVLATVILTVICVYTPLLSDAASPQIEDIRAIIYPTSNHLTADRSSNQNTATEHTVLHKATATASDITWPKCIPWESLTENHVNRSVCIYGQIEKINTTDAYAQIIRFSKEAGTFALLGRRVGYRVEPGDCVLVEGVIRSNSSYLLPIRLYFDGITEMR